MANVMDLYSQVTRLPAGKKLFSVLFSQKAPFFATVRPRFVELRPNYAELRIKKRRRVQNHIGTLHVIAICNGLEAAMGALAEVTVPADYWPEGGAAVKAALAPTVQEHLRHADIQTTTVTDRPATMTAIEQRRYGTADELRLGERPLRCGARDLREIRDRAKTRTARDRLELTNRHGCSLSLRRSRSSLRHFLSA